MKSKRSEGRMADQDTQIAMRASREREELKKKHSRREREASRVIKARMRDWEGTPAWDRVKESTSGGQSTV